TTSPPRQPHAEAICHDFTAYTTLCPPPTPSSAATRNRMSPAITRSFPSTRRPEKIETAASNAPVRTAYSKERVRWLISPETLRGRRRSEGRTFASPAARVSARRTGKALSRVPSVRESRTAAERARSPRSGSRFAVSTDSPYARAAGRAVWRRVNEDALAEKHAQPSLLSDFILGSQDGLVNVLGVILGVAVASRNLVDPFAIILAGGLAATFAESISMGAVAYTSTIARRDHYAAEVEREREEMVQLPDLERQ